MATEHIDTPAPGSYTAMCEERERVLRGKREYVYRGDRLTRPELRGARCTAVLRDGKCVCSRLGTMLVTFGGEPVNVLRRQLRKVTE